MGISKIGKYTFYIHPKLEKVKTSARTIEEGAFQSAPKLETVDLTSTAADTINTNAFSGCSNLTHLVVRSTTRSSLSATSALDNTKIQFGEGGVYVPADLLDSYKSATNWSTIAANIFPIGEYPRANFDSISADWSTILTNPDYATAYAVKDSKTMELTDGAKIKMDLAAFDTDVKSDNTGKAKMTWICHSSPYTHSMYTLKSSHGWANSDMRSWLISDILSKIPTEIKSHIVSVKKSYRSKSPTDETLWSDDEIWLPSYKEVGFTNASYVESDGVTYPRLFPSNADRIKAWIHHGRIEAYWWTLRSAASSTNYVQVEKGGTFGSNLYSATNMVIFGFCTD